MAKVSKIKRNEQRKELIDRYANKRAKLTKIAKDRSLDSKERAEAVLKLSKLPRNSSKVRYRNRCALTGRPRAYHGFFGICRNELRRLASLGLIPGVKKSSW